MQTVTEAQREAILNFFLIWFKRGSAYTHEAITANGCHAIHYMEYFQLDVYLIDVSNRMKADPAGDAVLWERNWTECLAYMRQIQSWLKPNDVMHRCVESAVRNVGLARAFAQGQQYWDEPPRMPRIVRSSRK